MENNNNNKKKNRKAIWIISSLLSVAVLGLGAVIAWKLFTPSTQQNNITVEKENLLFKKNDIEPFKLNIEKTKWAEDEFKNNYQSLSLREFTKSNLKVDGNSISNLIEEVYPISKKEIQINLSKYSNFNYLLSEDVTRELSYLVNNLLYIDNLDVEFIQGVRIMNLNFLIDAIDNFIREPLKKYTLSDFVKYIGEGENDNKKQFIEKVIQPNLFITPTTNIDLANIKDVRFDSNNNLLIELQNEGIKYYIDVQDEVGNVSISNNIITIESLNYYKPLTINEINLIGLKNTIQNFINQDNNRFSSKKFEEQINSSTFKTQVINQLNIGFENIGSIEFKNNILTISPAKDYKIIVSNKTSASNSLMDNYGNIILSGFEFYNDVNLINLSDLYNSINQNISNNKFTKEEFTQAFTKNEDIKNLIKSNLRISETSVLSPTLIQDISLDSLYHINIVFNTTKTNINIPSNTIQEIFWENSEDSIVNSKLVIKNLKFYNNILISNDNLNNLESNIQKYINENQLTSHEFESNSLGYSSSIFKEKIENYLGIKGLNSISKISFENNILTISPIDNDDSRNKFSSLNTSNLINQNSEIQINLSNLKFFSDMRINNLAQLRSSIISYIVNSDRKLTIDEFEQYLTDNTKKAEIIQTIADNISVFANNTRSISVDKIKNINLVVNPENNQTRDLQIELDSDFVKYQLSESTNAGTLKDNILTVKNLEFYNAINIPTDKLNKLQNNIQNYINSPENKLLLDDFIKTTNTEAFKKEVANYLGVTDTRLISSIFYNNDVLTITPLVDSVNNNRNKFTTPTASNLIDNGNIIVSGFNFFNLIQLTNTDNLASIINSINLNENNKFTPSDFRNYISDAKNLSDLKNTIANNIQTGWNQTLDINKIENIQLNDSNQLVISLDSDFVKYSLSRNSSVVVTPNSNLNQENSQLIINNLQFYTQISISDNDLISIKTKINEYIVNNNIASGNSISSEQLKQFMQNIKATVLPDNTQSDLLSLISNVKFVNNSVQITFNNLIKIDDKEVSNQDISVSNNVIIISNFDFQPNVDFYQWSGNTIIGLEELGKQQTSLVLPGNTTAISKNVFANNTKIEYVDMSKTKIKDIPSGSSSTGLFSGCNNLKTVLLPDELNSIGFTTFKGCKSLSLVTVPNKQSAETVEKQNILPSKLTTIGWQAFSGCSSLKNIVLPDTLTSIDQKAFYESGLTSVTIPSSVTNIGQNAFQYCTSLTEVTLPDNLTTINIYVFANCTNLAKINIPDSIEKIEPLAFQYSSKVQLHVSSEEMKEKVEGFGLALATPTAGIVVDNKTETTPENKR